MNAYELAKYIEDDIQIQEGIADMLRQQADRIAELEKALEHEGISVGRDLLNGGVALSKKLPQTKPLSDEEIYELWCEADNTELLPEMRLKDGSINYIITTFAKLIEERHGIK